MGDPSFPAYEELPARIEELIGRLRRHADANVGNDALRVQMLTEEFNRVFVHRVVDKVLLWRGEIFLGALLRDDVARVFFERYGISDPD